MKRLRATLLGVLMIIILSGNTCTREKLTIERQDYTGTALRLDGFYYNKKSLAHFFLYRNGVMYYGGSGFGGHFGDMINFYSDAENYKNDYHLPYSWGVFVVNGSEILFERWRSSDAFGGYPVSRFSGVILNETTLLVNFPAESVGQDTFIFYPFSPKPDSLNVFIQ